MFECLCRVCYSLYQGKSIAIRHPRWATFKKFLLIFVRDGAATGLVQFIRLNGTFSDYTRYQGFLRIDWARLLREFSFRGNWTIDFRYRFRAILFHGFYFYFYFYFHRTSDGIVANFSVYIGTANFETRIVFFILVNTFQWIICTRFWYALLLRFSLDFLK